MAALAWRCSLAALVAGCAFLVVTLVQQRPPAAQRWVATPGWAAGTPVRWQARSAASSGARAPTRSLRADEHSLVAASEAVRPVPPRQVPPTPAGPLLRRLLATCAAAGLLLLAAARRHTTPAAPATWAAVAYGPSTKWGRFKATLKMKNWHKKHDLWFAHDDEVYLGDHEGRGHSKELYVLPTTPRLEDYDPEWDEPPKKPPPVRYTYDYS